jgi:CheY-like chemotaxis protein
MEQEKKRVLLVDLEDSRRETRIKLLESAGYEVGIRTDHVVAERLDHEAGYDLIIIALHRNPGEAAAYGDRVSRINPNLPILLLTDAGVFAPSGTLNQSVEAGRPFKLMQEVASMLAGSSHVASLPTSPAN